MDAVVEVVTVVLEESFEARSMASTMMMATSATPTMTTGTNQEGRADSWASVSATAAP